MYACIHKRINSSTNTITTQKATTISKQHE